MAQSCPGVYWNDNLNTLKGNMNKLGFSIQEAATPPISTLGVRGGEGLLGPHSGGFAEENDSPGAREL